MLMTGHFSGLGSAIDWSCCEGILLQPIRSTTRHQYGISALICQMSFCREFAGDIAKCQLFSQATKLKL